MKQEKLLQVILTNSYSNYLYLYLLIILEPINCQTSACTIRIELQEPTSPYSTNSNDRFTSLYWDGNFNLNEVEVWAGSSSSSTKVPPSALSKSLSSYYNNNANGINSCFDGNTATGCSSSLNVPYSTQRAFLTITTTTSININNIRVYNRIDCCGGRMRNAKISVSVGSSVVWSDQFDNNEKQDVYNFVPTSNAATSSNKCIAGMLF